MFVTVADWVCVVPVVTVPKLNEAGLAERVPGATPLPESATFALPALEVTLTLPLAAPDAVGANVTEKFADWPAFKVTGSVNPLTLYPGPLAEIAETVTALPPEFVTVLDRVCLLPVATFPKFRDVGLAEIEPGATPVPERETEVVGVGAFDVIVTFPLALPVAAGANATENFADWPALRVTGSVRPLTLNPVPLALIAETVTALPPEFVIVSDRLCVEPVVTLPKLRDAGLGDTAPAVTPVPDRDTEAALLTLSVAMVTLPLVAPAEAGANVTLKVTACPGFSPTGRVIPETLYPLPVALTPVMFSRALPLFVIVSETV